MAKAKKPAKKTAAPAKKKAAPAKKKTAPAKKKAAPAKLSARARGLTVDDYEENVVPSLRPVVAALRALVKSAAPEVTEGIKWAQPVYEKNGPVMFVKAWTEHVTFGFWRGAALHAAGFTALDDGGDRMRHVKLYTPAQIDKDGFAKMIRAAVKLNEELGDPTKR